MDDRAPLSEKLEDALDAGALAVVWDRIGQQRARRSASLGRAAGFAAVAAAIALVSHFVRVGDDGPLMRADAAPLVLVPEGASIALSDGSRVTASRDADLQVIDNRSDRIEWRLARGRARFDVRPRGPRTWHVACAGVSVEVSGTSFVVDRASERVRVDVLEGVVLVRHPALPDGVRRIERGEHVEVSLEVRTPSEVVAPRVTTSGAEPARATRDIVEPEVDSASLLRRADEARRTRQFGAAIEALETIVSRHPRSHEAPFAAFTLGRLEEDRGHYGNAARAYRRAVALGLREPLREQANAHVERLRALGAE